MSSCVVGEYEVVDIYFDTINRANVEWGENRFGLKRLDFGLSFGVGFVFKRVLLGADFDRSLVNINSDTVSSSDKTRNNVFRISVGWRLVK